ncbi:TIR domain-containing protein [Aliirhizobium smilacinae]|nr:TIR domain-containing protein [Rhizobium smilacinae]
MAMIYNFANLSHGDFENLVRDLVGRAIGVRFEAFAAGPDGGIDGRYIDPSGKTILQAKHYQASKFSDLKRAMVKERASIDRLEAERYILATSQPLTPANKTALRDVIGPSLRSEADIFGIDDLVALLRQNPDLVTVHEKLWMQSAPVLETILTSALDKYHARPRSMPQSLADLLEGAAGQPKSPLTERVSEGARPRDVIFLSKASPHDDEFALWLAPKLEAEGYKVFTDLLTLEPGDRWRKEISAALQHRAVKVLVLCRDATLSDDNVQEDILIAGDLGKALGDKRFLIPLRLQPYHKVPGLADAVYVDFVRGWGDGLAALLETLRRQNVPFDKSGIEMQPNWEIFRRRGAIPLKDEPERLTSNWLRIAEVPDAIRFYEPSGVVERGLLQRAIDGFEYFAVPQGTGFFTFAGTDEVEREFDAAGRFKLKHEIPVIDFVEHGLKRESVTRQVASNILHNAFKKAWFAYCRDQGLVEYHYSNAVGFHASSSKVAIRQRVPWGRQGEGRRWSMLRNVAKGHIWNYGVTAIPSFQPFFHFKLKSRVLFSVATNTEEGLSLDDARKQHRLRRTICKGWRNKQWYGRMLAFLEMLSGESAFIRLRLAENAFVVLEATPMLFTSPVSTDLPDALADDDDEADLSTLGRPEPEEVDE